MYQLNQQYSVILHELPNRSASNRSPRLEKKRTHTPSHGSREFSSSGNQHIWPENCHPCSRLGLAWRAKEPSFENKNESNHGLKRTMRTGMWTRTETVMPGLLKGPCLTWLSQISPRPLWCISLCNKLLFGLLEWFAMLFCSF